MNAPSPLSGATETIAVAVCLNDHLLPDEVALRACSVDLRVSTSTARLVISGDRLLARVGDRVEIRAGYGDMLRPIFHGEVQQLEFKADGARRSQWSLSCLGRRRTTPATTSAPVLSLTYGADVAAAALANATPDRPQATTGTIRFQGSALVLPGDTVSLADFPSALFCGIAPVCRVAHEIAEGNWQTTVELGSTHPH